MGFQPGIPFKKQSVKPSGTMLHVSRRSFLQNFGVYQVHGLDLITTEIKDGFHHLGRGGGWRHETTLYNYLLLHFPTPPQSAGWSSPPCPDLGLGHCAHQDGVPSPPPPPAGVNKLTILYYLPPSFGCGR